MEKLTIVQLKSAQSIGATRYAFLHGDLFWLKDVDGWCYFMPEKEHGWQRAARKVAASEWADSFEIDFTPLNEFEAEQKKYTVSVAAEALDKVIPPPQYNPADVAFKSTSDGSTASYYQLPPECTELQDLISYRNMNAQDGEIFRAIYRKGRASHSDALRDAKKVLFYAQAEVARLQRYME